MTDHRVEPSVDQPTADQPGAHPAGTERHDAHADVAASVESGTLPPPADARLPSSPLSADPLSPGALPLPRWVGVLAVSCALLLIPWIVYLAFVLPQQSRSAHYDVAWVGFDVAMFGALVSLGVCALRRSTYTEVLAAVTGTLLLTDAWFDVVTADTRWGRMEALASALLIELPLAGLCAWVANNAERMRKPGLPPTVAAGPGGRTARPARSPPGGPLRPVAVLTARQRDRLSNVASSVRTP